MHDGKQLLERARRSAPIPRFDLEDVRARRQRRERRRRVGAAGVGLGLTVAMVAAVVFAMGSLGPDRSRPGADDVLPPTTRPLPVLNPGEYSYQRIRLSTLCAEGAIPEPPLGCGQTRLLMESWWALDDSGRIDVLEQHAYGARDGRFGPGEFPDEGDLSGFPTEPRALRSFLLDRSAPGGASPRPNYTPTPGASVEDGLVWRAIQDYLGSTQYLNVTPELRAAMLRVLAGLPMVRVEETATDPAGRAAVALRFRADGTDVEVFVAPDTGDLLALTGSYERGVTSLLVMEAAGVTPTIGDEPRGQDRSIPPATG